MTTLDRTVAYFGPGYCMPGDKFGPVLRPNTTYLCFEPPGPTTPERIIALETYSKILTPSAREVVKLLRRSARNTRLPTSSVDAVHIYNLLTAREKMRQPEDFVREGLRIVKPGEWIYSGETRTPWVFPLERLLDLPCLRGLAVETMLDLSKQGWDDRAKRLVVEQIGAFYEEGSGVNKKDAYIVRIQKS